jgi:hypothetical protein
MSQGSLPARYWVESLHATIYLLDLLPTKAISAPSSYFALFSPLPPTHTFKSSGALAIPTSWTSYPCSYWCVFPGYSSNHKGYQCLDVSSNHFLISQHVFFDVFFPFPSTASSHPSLLMTLNPYLSLVLWYLLSVHRPPSCHMYLEDHHRDMRGTGDTIYSMHIPSIPICITCSNGLPAHVTCTPIISNHAKA